MPRALAAARPGEAPVERRRVPRKKRRHRGREPKDRHGIFPEDHVVLSRCCHERIGWVTQVHGYSFDPFAEDGGKARQPAPGACFVQWLDQPDPVQEALHALVAVERPFGPGDRVVREHRDGRSLGTVLRADRVASVRVGGRLHDVSVRHLRPAGGPWRVDDLVRHATKPFCLGRVFDALFDVEIVSPQGVCRLRESTEYSTKLEPWGAEDDPSPDELCPHFPGQQLCGPHEAWAELEWLVGQSPTAPRQPQRRRPGPKGVVRAVHANQVAVRWSTTGELDEAALEEWVPAQDLEVLPWMWEDGWRLGDHVVPAPAIGTGLAVPGEALPVHLAADFAPGRSGVLARLHSQVHVRWLDATESTVPSLQLKPWRGHMAGHEFLPHQFVSRSESVLADGLRRRGVVVQANLQERTCKVRWQDGEEELCSVYELSEHPDFDFLAGDTVVRLVARGDLDACGWAGIVRGVTVDGTLEVQWLCGQTEQVAVEEVLRIEGKLEAEGEESALAQGFVHWSVASDEVESFAEGALGDAALAQALEPGQEAYLVQAGPAQYLVLGPDGLPGEAPPGAADEELEPEPDPAPEEAGPADEDEGEGPFTTLDFVPADHKFASADAASLRPAVLRRELQALLKGLPRDGTILVRGFDSRMDLFRAVILGPQGTPYADVPFVFDVRLPPGYPQLPPSVLAHPVWGRERLNPNLYGDGKVCLSLLGTWEGPGWAAGTSTLLQVLVSIQALVLTDQPYYNEPGFELQAGTADGSRNAALYNENARILALHGACALAEAPVGGLERELAAHFAEVGPRLCVGPQEGQSPGYAVTLDRLLPRLRRACKLE